MNNIIIYNPNNKLFFELENFLNYFYPSLNLPICIQQSLCDSDHILYNTEQLTRPDQHDFILSIKNNVKIYEVWDYSNINISILNSYGIYNTKYVPLKIWPDYKNKIYSFNPTYSYDYDIGFCGWVHGKRRIDILNDIRNSNISIDIIEDQYGAERDKRLSKCKILLNIHFNETYKIFEQYRCFPWLDTGKIVVSENSLDNDIRCINVEYEEIVPTLRRILKNDIS